MNNKLIIIILILILGFFAVLIADSADSTRQEVCPNDNGWTKVDNLSGFEYTFDVPDGYEVVENCYKASTDVVYGTGDTVESQTKHELSHASFKLEKLPEQPPEDNCIDDECSNHQPKEAPEEPKEEPEQTQYSGK